MILACMLTLTMYQSLDMNHAKSWEALAMPWMTAEEALLYPSLSHEKKILFRGIFVARRLDNPRQWPDTGLFLPCFYPPVVDGDIRDAVRYLLGEPARVESMTGNPKLPRTWVYDDKRISFRMIGGSKVALDTDGQAVWRQAVARLVKHPDLLYDFRIKPFGRTRVPDEIAWTSTNVAATQLVPETNGATLQASVAITPSFRDKVRAANAEAHQTMEVLVLLKNVADNRGDSLDNPNRIRHTSRYIDLFENDRFTFEVLVPEGHFEAEIMIYSGFLSLGMRTTTTLTVLPSDMPRIGTPILSQSWKPSSIVVPTEPAYNVAGTLYMPTDQYDPKQPAEVIVASYYDRTELRLQRKDSADVLLERKRQVGPWHVFPLPSQPDDTFRLLAIGYPESGDQVAVSHRGTAVRDNLPQDKASLVQANSQNYLNLERLALTGAEGSNLNILTVNGQPIVGTTGAQFTWPSFDWGREANVTVTLMRESGWHQVTTRLKRAQLFEELQVTPKFLVVGTRDLKGMVTDAEVSVSVLDQQIPPTAVVPLAAVPKLWGVMVNDPLLKSPRWPAIRDQLKTWFQHNLGEQDLVYLVHNARRPKLLLEPTTIKPALHAALEALAPKTRNENYFTVQYLLDALTHLKHHQSRPHQVLLLTNRLTDELEQMEELLPRLRSTGLQLYNLEFPLSFTPETETKVADAEDDALAIMAAKEAEDQRDRIAMRDNFQERRNVTASWGIQFKSRATRRKEKEAQIRAEAFRDSFDTQLANLTAGMSFSDDAPDESASLAFFFDELTRWQQTLQHIHLDVPLLEEDMIKVHAKDNAIAAWTLVEWSPN